MFDKQIIYTISENITISLHFIMNMLNKQCLQNVGQLLHNIEYEFFLLKVMQNENAVN